MIGAKALREQGNKYFAAGGEAVDLNVRRTRLHQALDKYHAALRTANTDYERASACKNLAATTSWLARLPASSGADAEEVQLQVLAHRSSAVGHFAQAADLGQRSKPDAWVEDCWSKADAAYHQLLDGTDGDEAATLLALERIRAALSGNRGMASARLLLRIAEKLFHMSVVHCDQRQHRAANQLASEARRPLAEAEAAACRLSSTGAARDAKEFARQTEELRNSLFIQLCLCESAQARKDADQLLHRAVHDSEQLDLEGVYDALDLLKQAAILTREVDLEGEAMALSRAGYVLRALLHDHERAKKYYKRAMQLATSLAPRSFHFEDWWQDCSSALLAYQQEALRQEEEARQAEREPILKELAPELEALSTAASRGYHHLLRHLYSAHPPANPEHRLDEEPDAANAKRLLKQALLHYHSDKTRRNLMGAVDPREHVLREEITKHLNAAHALFK